MGANKLLKHLDLIVTPVMQAYAGTTRLAQYETLLIQLQAKQEPLSEQQILDCAESTRHKFDLDPEVNFKGLVNIARAIEAAHGITGGGVI